MSPRHRRTAALVIGSALAATLSAHPGADASRAGTGPSAAPQDPQILENGRWAVAGERVRVELDPADLRLEIAAGERTWRLRPSTPGDLLVKTRTGIVPLRLADATVKEVGPYRTGYSRGFVIALRGFAAPAQPAAADTPPDARPPILPSQSPVRLDFEIRIFIELESREDDLTFRIVASEGADAVREVDYPPSPEPDSFDRTVVPFMQGMLLPRDWPRPVRLYDEIAYSRGLYMPWWGFEREDGAALFVLLETPDDAGIRFEHPAGGPTRADVRWLSSLGHFAEPRRARLAFLDRGGYVALAKRYRSQAILTGNFVSLKEKIARNPAVARLAGSPVIHVGILDNIQPESSYYQKDDPAANHRLVTFDRRREQFRALAARGLARAYVHLDGWGLRGYDNLHPDILPPSPEAGGWDGLTALAAACRDANLLLALHDQYRDYYFDAASFDLRHAVLNEDGTHPEGSTWYGGRQSILCSALAPGYVRRNYGEILSHGVDVRGAYLDVFSVVPGDECWSPEHPVTRGRSLDFRGQCFDVIRSFGGVVSSEEPADWAIPYLDLAHHGPHALDPNPGAGPAMGIPIPLFDLVYHDAIFLPWSLGKGSWGIPETDSGLLYGLGHAGLPYLSIEPDAAEWDRVRTMCALNERLAGVEMVNHQFLDGRFRRQRFVYADGTRVDIDLDSNAWMVAPALKSASAFAK